LDRYVLAELLRVFGFFSLVMVAVYWVNQAALLFGFLVRDGQPVRIFAEFTALGLPFLVAAVLPISTFAAAVYVALGLLRSSEITVMQAAGLSPFRLLRPVVVFGLSVSAFLMVLTNLLVPLSQEQLSFRRGEVAGDIVATLLRPGTFLHPAEGMTLFITQITPEGMLRGLHVVDRRDPDTAVDYSARMALLVPDRAGPKLVMVDGIAQVLTSPEAARDQISVVRFADFTLDIGARSAPQDRARALAEVPSGELWATSDAVLAETRASPTHLAHERLVRIIEPLSAISAAILGFAVILAAGFTRLGLWRPVVAGVLVMALAQGLGNAIAGQSMRFDWAHWALPLPGLMLLGAGLGGLAHAMRQRRGRRP